MKFQAYGQHYAPHPMQPPPGAGMPGMYPQPPAPGGPIPAPEGYAWGPPPQMAGPYGPPSVDYGPQFPQGPVMPQNAPSTTTM